MGGVLVDSEEAQRITMKKRAYFSSHQLWAGEHFIQVAQEIESSAGHKPRFDIQQRAYITSAILSAVAFLEAAINELCKDVVDKHESYIAPLDTDSRMWITVYWDLIEGKDHSSSRNILQKYQDILKYCGKDQFLSGAEPYQDVALVVRLRNALMHYKPESYGGDIQHELSQKLRNKFAENPLAGPEDLDFPDKYLGSPCAAWAISATKNLACQFFQKLGVSPNYQRVKF
jgi:hypothetical protein